MLTTIEKIIFIVAVLASVYAAYLAAFRIIRTVGKGQGKVDWQLVQNRLFSVLGKIVSLQPTFRIRLGPSLFHAFVAWGFMYYLLVD